MESEIKEIRVDGEEGDWYMYAKFVLKPHITQKHLPRNMVEYADQLIERHLKVYPVFGKVDNRMRQQKDVPASSSKVDRSIDRFLIGSMVAVAVSVLFYFLY